jgi:hypothetical protein
VRLHDRAVAAAHDQKKFGGGDFSIHPDKVSWDALQQLLRRVYDGGEAAGWGRGVRAARGEAIRRQPERWEGGGSSGGSDGDCSWGSSGGGAHNSSQTGGNKKLMQGPWIDCIFIPHIHSTATRTTDPSQEPTTEVIHPSTA